MKYTIYEFLHDFPDERSCLIWLFEFQHPDGVYCVDCSRVTKHYLIIDRKTFSCGFCGHHVSPTANTIFHNSHIILRSWFYIMYQMATNKAGVNAKHVERELGISYRSAWRMMHQIRRLMESPEGLLSGEVEIDESYIHANVYKRSSAKRKYGNTGNRSGQVLFGMVERGGRAKVWHVKSAGARVLKPLIGENVKYGSLIHTDGYRAYSLLPRMGYEHRSTNHTILEFYRPDSHTQNIENLWSTMKPRWRGVFKYISPAYLQSYANEYTWRYSHRNDVSMFWSLMICIT